MVDRVVKQNDTAPVLEATLSDANGVVDLTGCSVDFLMMNQDTGTLKVSAAASVYSAAGGVVRYTWGSTDLDTVGVYNCVFEVTFADLTVTTFPSDGYFTVEVTKDLN